jgi:hypothetical protein
MDSITHITALRVGTWINLIYRYFSIKKNHFDFFKLF